MANINDLVLTAIGASDYNASLIQFFQDNGATSSAFNDAAIEFLEAQGYTTGAINDRLYAFLGDLGYTGDLSDRWFKFWLDGGLGSGFTYPAELAFFALGNDPDQANAFVADVIVGTGSITEASTSTRYYPDENNVWQAYGSGVVGKFWHDGRYWMPYNPAWTNEVTYSYNLTNAAWTKTNVTAALTQTGMRGDANGATLLTATANNGTCVLASAVTAASSDQGTRWFLKRSAGTGTVELTLDNGSTWVDITTALDAATGWYEAVINQTVANPQIGIRLGTSGDAVIVGNAELMLTVSESASAKGLLTWNTPIFTAGATGSVVESVPTVDYANHNNTIGFYYHEIAVGVDDDDCGLIDMYIPSFDNTGSDSTPSNFANGQVWSMQFLQPGAGGSTSQVTRSVKAGETFQICGWYNANETVLDKSNYCVDGDRTSAGGSYVQFDTDNVFYLIRDQESSQRGFPLLIRNFMRYDITDMTEGGELEFDLTHPTYAWGQNRVTLSNRQDLYVNNGNPWVSVVGATAARDAVDLEGNANGATTITDPGTSLSYLRQINIPITTGTSRWYTGRVFIRKDTDTTRFPTINFQTVGGTNQSTGVRINTQTGETHIVSGPGTVSVQTATYNSDWWELLVEWESNAANTSGSVNIYPASATTLTGSNDATATGSIVIGNAEFYEDTRAADVIGNDPAYTPVQKDFFFS